MGSDNQGSSFFTISLNASCSSTGVVLCGTGLGLNYERPRRHGILRSVSDLACLPVSILIISFIPSRCHDAGPNPYLEIPAHPRHYLLECLPVQNPLSPSRLPVEPSAQTALHHPNESLRTVEYSLISSRAMNHVCCPSCACSRRS